MTRPPPFKYQSQRTTRRVMVMNGVPSNDRLTELGVSRISYGPIPYAPDLILAMYRIPESNTIRSSIWKMTSTGFRNGTNIRTGRDALGLAALGDGAVKRVYLGYPRNRHRPETPESCTYCTTAPP
jgi:hypothetical protein